MYDVVDSSLIISLFTSGSVQECSGALAAAAAAAELRLDLSCDVYTVDVVAAADRSRGPRVRQRLQRP